MAGMAHRPSIVTVIHVISCHPGVAGSPKSGQSDNARVYEYTP